VGEAGEGRGQRLSPRETEALRLLALGTGLVDIEDAVMRIDGDD
jgi:hypothetical protein